MTEKITINTAEKLVESFYERLRRHGWVARALNEASSIVSDQSDVLVPALFSRLEGEPLFSHTENGQRPLPITIVKKNEERKLAQHLSWPKPKKFKDKLINAKINFYKDNANNSQLIITLTITFGTQPIEIAKTNQNLYIRFGIKYGQLEFKLKDAFMLEERYCLTNNENNWQVTPIEREQEEPLAWEFISKDNQPKILSGIIHNQVLGTVNILNENIFEVEGSLKIDINRICIEIIDWDKGWDTVINKKQKESMMGELLKYLKKELEDTQKESMMGKLLRYLKKKLKDT